jgi:CheY-like chemotaxis protein
VFVVGRNRAARRVLTGALSRELGVQAVSMASGNGAADWARAVRPALVFLDAGLDREGAADLIRRLRAEPATAGTVILAAAPGDDGFASRGATKSWPTRARRRSSRRFAAGCSRRTAAARPGGKRGVAARLGRSE